MKENSNEELNAKGGSSLIRKILYAAGIVVFIIGVICIILVIYNDLTRPTSNPFEEYISTYGIALIIISIIIIMCSILMLIFVKKSSVLTAQVKESKKRKSSLFGKSNVFIKKKIMSKFERYYKYFPLIIGILLIIGLLTPAAALSSWYTEFLWMFGFVYYDNGSSSGISLPRFSAITVSSIICSIIILLLALYSFTLYFKAKRGRSITKNSISLSILSIIITITWMILMEIIVQSYYAEEFWIYYRPSFGVIAPFICVSIAIIGAVANKHYSMIEERNLKTEEDKIEKSVSINKVIFKRYYWVFPLINGILLLTALITPAVRIEWGIMIEYWWMWGLISGAYDPMASFQSSYSIDVNTTIYVTSIICSIIILFLALSSFILSYKAKRGRCNEIASISLSIMSFIITIIWISIMGTIVPIIVGYSYLVYYSYSFGVIAPFIGGIIAIIGALVSKFYSKIEDRKVITEKNKFGKPVPLIKNTIPIEESIKTRIKFCPECKTKVEEENKFCNLCGYNLQNS